MALKLKKHHLKIQLNFKYKTVNKTNIVRKLVRNKLELFKFGEIMIEMLQSKIKIKK